MFKNPLIIVQKPLNLQDRTQFESKMKMFVEASGVVEDLHCHQK